MKNENFPVNQIDSHKELRQLISKCGGLPKVIVAVADSFSQDFDWAERTRILNHQFVSNLEARMEFASLRGLFSWMHSYLDSLPDLLRQHIAYLLIFPRNSNIRRRRLLMRWVAEGYSQDSDTYTAYENGEELFSKLVKLSMIQIPPLTAITDMRMVSYSLSGIFHEYMATRPLEENIATAIEAFALRGTCSPTSRRRGRHLVIEESWNRDRIVFKNIDFSKLRSLTVYGKWESFLISESMKVLRVLDLEDASDVRDEDIQKIPELLPRLKFLSLRGCCKVSYLPSSVGYLRQLQTLDIRRTSIVMLPASITKLKKLQYLRAGTTAPVPRPIGFRINKLGRCRQLVGIKAESGLGELTALNTLGVVNVGAAVGKAILGDVEKLTHLRKLGFTGISKKNIKELCSAIMVQAQLESLSVSIDKDSQQCLDDVLRNSAPLKKLQSLKLYGLVEKLPEPINMLSRLKKLELEITISTEVSMTVLGDLKELCILRLCVRPLEVGKLDFRIVKDGVEDYSYGMVKVLEIACNSPLVIIFGSKVMKNIEQLMARCSSGLTLQFDELPGFLKLRKVHLIGLHNNALKELLEEQLKMHPNKPVFKVE